METLAGIFFSVISIFGLIRCQAKKSIRKIVLITFSVFLILGQVLFISRVLNLAGEEFAVFSGLVGGIILILALQKNEPW